MSSHPWLKFFPADWLGDPKLRACSIAARGLWIDMLSIAHDATPYGHLAVDGAPMDTATLARMTGLDEAECAVLIEELGRHRVYSRTRKNVIYSRRMVRDAKKAARARKIGKLGGNPSLLKTSAIPPQDNPQLKPQSPESRVQKANNLTRARGAVGASPSAPDDNSARQRGRTRGGGLRHIGTIAPAGNGQLPRDPQAIDWAGWYAVLPVPRGDAVAWIEAAQKRLSDANGGDSRRAQLQLDQLLRRWRAFGDRRPSPEAMLADAVQTAAEVRARDPGTRTGLSPTVEREALGGGGQ